MHGVDDGEAVFELRDAGHDIDDVIGEEVGDGGTTDVMDFCDVGAVLRGCGCPFLVELRPCGAARTSEVGWGIRSPSGCGLGARV